MTKFKVGDKVKIVDESVEEDKHLIGLVGFVAKNDEDYDENSDTNCVDVDFKKPIKQNNNDVNDTTHTFHERDLKLLKKGKIPKPKTPTHLVIWEEDEDPCKFFESLDLANIFIKELSENSDVKQDSIILVEIKTARKVTIQKRLAAKEFKI